MAEKFGVQIRVLADKSDASQQALKASIDSLIRKSLEKDNVPKISRIVVDANNAQTQSALRTSINKAFKLAIKDKEFTIKTVKVESIDTKAAVTRLRQDLEKMLSGLSVAGNSITGLRDILSDGASDSFAKSMEAAADAAERAANAHDRIDNKKQLANSLNKAIKPASQAYDKTGTFLDEDARNRVIEGYKELEKLSIKYRADMDSGIAVTQDEVDAFKRKSDALGVIAQEQKKARQEQERANKEAVKAANADPNAGMASSKSIENFRKQVQSFASNNSKLMDNPEWAHRITLILDAIPKSAAMSSEALEGVRGNFAKLAADANEAGMVGKNSLDKIVGNVAKYGGWMLVTRAVAVAVRGMKQMVETVKEVNTAITDLKIVSGEVDSAFDRFGKTTASAAKQIGVSISSLLASATEWARLGYTLQESLDLSKIANVYSKVASVDIDEATKSLVSTLKAFGEGADYAETIVDKYTLVANKFAIDAGGIGEAFQKSAASLVASGNDIDQALALVTAGNLVVQDASSTGTALKTTTLRIRGAKADLESMGESTDDLADSVSDLREKMKALSGVDIMLNEDTFKSTYQILKEIAGVFEGISDINQAAITELLAGKRNSNVILSILQNFDEAEAVLATSQNAAGAAMDANEIRLDSVGGKLEIMSATFQELSQSMINTDAFKFLIDGATTLLSILTGIADTLGGLPVLIGAATLAGDVAGKKTGLFKSSGTSITFRPSGQSMSPFGTGLSKEDHAALVAYNEEITSITDKYKDWGIGIDEIRQSVPYQTEAQEALNATMAGTSKAAQQAAVGIQTGQKSIEAYSVATAAGVAATTALRMAMNMVASMAIAAVVNGLITLVYRAANAKKEANKAAQEAAQLTARESAAIEEQGAKITKLRATLDSTTSSFEDSTFARAELIAVQSELISTYGLEAGAIDVVNGSLDEQLDKLREIAKQKKKESFAEHRDSYTKALSNLGKREASTVLVSPEEQNLQRRNDLQGIIDGFGKAGMLQISDGYDEFGAYIKASMKLVIEGTAAERKEVYSALSSYLENQKKSNSKYTNDLSFIQSEISKAMKTASDVIDDNKTNAQEGYEGILLSDDAISKMHTTLADLVVGYKEALASGEDTVDNLATMKAEYDKLVGAVNGLVGSYGENVTRGLIDGIKNEFLPTIADGISAITNEAGLALVESLSKASGKIDILNDRRFDDLREASKFDSNISSIPMESMEATDGTQILFTPVLPNGEIMAGSALADYIQSLMIQLGKDAPEWLVNLKISKSSIEDFKSVGEKAFSNSDVFLGGFDGESATSDMTKYAKQIVIADKNYRGLLDKHVELVGLSHSFDYNAAKLSAASRAAQEKKRSIDALKKSIESFTKASSVYTKIRDISAQPIDLELWAEIIELYPELADKFDDYNERLSKGLVDNAQILSVVEAGYRDAAEAVGVFADAVDNAEGSVAEILSAAQSEYDLLETIKEDIKEAGSVTIKSLESIASTYPDLTDAVNLYSLGLMTEAEMIRRVEAEYEKSLKSQVRALANKAASSREFYTKFKADNADALKELGEAYKIDLSNFATLTMAKEELSKSAVKTVVESWGDNFVDSLMKFYAADLKNYATTEKAKQEIAKANVQDKYRSFYDESGSLNQSALDKYLAPKARKDAESGVSNGIMSTIPYLDSIKDSLFERAAGSIGGLVDGLTAEQRAVKEVADAVSKVQAEIDAIVEPAIAGMSSIKTGLLAAGSSSGKDVDKYIADIDRLYDVTRRLTEVQDEYATVVEKINLLPDNYYGQTIGHMEHQIALIGKENELLHERNELRRQVIQDKVTELRNQGFDIDYNASQNELAIRNMEHLNRLTGKDVESTNEIIKAAEKLIENIQSMNKDAVADSIKWLQNAKGVVSAYVDIEKKRQEMYTDSSDRREDSRSLIEGQLDVHKADMNSKAIMDNFERQRIYALASMRSAEQEADRVRRGIADGSIAMTDDITAYLTNLSKTWWDEEKKLRDINKEIVGQVLKKYDDLIDKADKFNLWDNIMGDTGLTKLDILKRRLKDINNLLAAGKLTAEEYNTAILENGLMIYQEQKEAIEEIIELTEKMIEQEVRDRVKALNDQIEAYQRIVDLQKEALDVKRQEDNYQKDVAKRVKAIADLQNRINILSRDDSRGATAERKKLEEELSALQEDLVDTQENYAYDQTIERIDKEMEKYQEQKEREIQILEESIDTQTKLYRLAISRIDSDWDKLYKDLLRWNSQYNDSIDGQDSLTSAWTTATNAMLEYHRIADAYRGIESQVVGQATTSGLNGNTSVTTGGTAAGNSNNQIQYSRWSSIKEAVEAMKVNASLWNNPPPGKTANDLANENMAIAKEVNSKFGTNFYRHPQTGVWYYDSSMKEQLFAKKFHTGGSVGGNLKANETAAILEKDETVLTSKMMKGVYRLIDFNKELANKIGSSVNALSALSSVSKDKMLPQNQNPSGIGSISLNVQVAAVPGMTDAQATEQGTKIATSAWEALASEFSKAGIGRGNTRIRPVVTGSSH